MSALELLAGRVPASWTTMLVDGAVKGFLVLAIAALVAVFLRHRSSSVRHLVWTLGVLALLAMPLVTWLVPSVRVPVPGNWVRHTPEAVAVAEVPDIVAVVEAPEPVIAIELKDRIRAKMRHGHGLSAGGHVRDLPVAVPPGAARARTSRFASPWVDRSPANALRHVMAPFASGSGPGSRGLPGRSALPGLWLLGVVAVFGWMAVQRLRLALVAGRAQRVVGGRCARMVDDIAWEMGIDGEILVLAGADDAMPMTWGVFRPVLLLPCTALTWSRERLDMVLRHELAHVARRDAMSQSMAELACALHWYNPLVWIAAARMRVEREHACDDLVLESGPRASDYATELLDIARTLVARPALDRAAIAMARRSHLRQRLSAVLDEDRPRARPTASVLAAAGLSALGIVLPLAALEPTALDARPVVEMPVAIRGVVEVRPDSRPIVVALPMIDVRATQSRVCRRSENGNATTNRNNESWRIQWEGENCRVDIRIEGEIGHDAMFTEITHIERGGLVELQQQLGGRTERLTIRPAGTDLVTMEYQVNGRTAEFDSPARAWYHGLLQEIARTTGIGADERAAAILERDGPQGVMQEIDELRSDRVRARYYRALLLSDRIPEATRAEFVMEAGADIRSDRELASLLSELHGHVAESAQVRSAVIATTEGIRSDREKVRVYTEYVDGSTLTSQQKAAVLSSARTVSSDRERGRLLSTIAAQTLDSSELHAAYIEAAATMSSDREKAQALARMLEAGTLNSRQLIAFFDAARTINSDRELASLLLTALETQRLDDPSREAFVRTLDSISSDREHRRVSTALERGR